jgi:hypothetical protein
MQLTNGLPNQKLTRHGRVTNAYTDCLFECITNSGCKSTLQAVYLMHYLKRSMTFVGLRGIS